VGWWLAFECGAHGCAPSPEKVIVNRYHFQHDAASPVPWSNSKNADPTDTDDGHTGSGGESPDGSCTPLSLSSSPTSSRPIFEPWPSARLVFCCSLGKSTARRASGLPGGEGSRLDRKAASRHLTVGHVVTWELATGRLGALDDLPTVAIRSFTSGWPSGRFRTGRRAGWCRSLSRVLRVQYLSPASDASLPRLDLNIRSIEWPAPSVPAHQRGVWASLSSVVLVSGGVVWPDLSEVVPSSASELS
jgi:hypothetical protein